MVSSGTWIIKTYVIEFQLTGGGIVIKKKGFTLIEIIISIALIGIIALALLPALSGNFKLLVNTKRITEDAFKAQQGIELVIEEVRSQIKSGSTPTGGKDYILFSGLNQRTVKGYLRQVNINNPPNPIDGNNKKIYTVIADTSIPDFKVATASNVAIKMYVGSNELKYAYSVTPSLAIKSQATITDPEHVNLMNLHQWYVSREGFNTPMIKSPNEIEKGKVYPRFPDDYMIIPSATSSNLTSILPNYAGRHILYTITPAAASGKMGATIQSNPVFISGLPVIENLKLHLDPSLINVFKEDGSYNTDYIRISSSDIFVKKWEDLSGNSNNAIQNTTTYQPNLVQERFGVFTDSNGINYDGYGKFLRFSGGQYLTLSNSNTLNLNDLTVFVVARSTATTANKSIISKYGSTSNDNKAWRLGWNESNKLGLFIKGDKNSDQVSGDVNEGLDGQWHILTASTGLGFQVDRNTEKTIKRTTNSITNYNPIYIGGDIKNSYSTVDIAEIIIYSSITDVDKAKVQDYLIKKYCK